MLNLLEKIYEKVRELYGPRHFAALFILLAIISGVGLLIGIKYTSYIRNNPDYCNSCHLMQKTFDGWRKSDHKSVTCQECHRLTVIEQDTLLVKHIIYGAEKVPQKHGKKHPWESCAGCHWEQGSQGKDKPEQSYGHYRHSFLECFNCHPFVEHNFPASADACKRCHRNKHVHGQSMEDVSCISCHIFTMREGAEKGRIFPTRQRCLNCHKSAFPQAAPMAALECFDCHNPHGALKPPDSLCIRCHQKDITDLGHKAHHVPCKDCHAAHSWRVENPRKTCSSCHPYRDPLKYFTK